MISIRKCKEHPDGSATCEFTFGKEDHQVILRHGLVALLTLGADMYKPVLDKPAKKVAKKVVKKAAKKKTK